MTGFDPIAAAAIGSFLSTLSSGGGETTSESDEFYTGLRDGFAKEIIAQYATGTVVLVKPDAARGADPLNPYEGATTRTTRNAVVMGYPTESIDNARVMFSDRRVIMDAADFTGANLPAGDDWLEIDGVHHTLVSLQAIPAAGPAVVFIMQARTGGG